MPPLDVAPAVATAADVDPMIGKYLANQYRVVEILGSGGMGTVYVVEHVQLKKQFAAKVLNAEMAKKRDSVARFELEALSASRLDHDNIVNVVNFGRCDDGSVFLVMELMRGMNLEQRMRRGPLSPDEIVKIIVPVCRALSAAHTAGIVHRDMKPENVFLARREGGRTTPKVLDFGVSKIKEEKLADARLTQTGQVLGSPLYMSPEASRGATDIDARADVYAVGIMLYELFCGRAPFQAENYLQVLHMHVNAKPRPPRELKPELSVALEKVILHALEKDKNKRYQNMMQLADALCAALPEVDPEGPLTSISSTTASRLTPSTPLSRSTPRPASVRRTETARTMLADDAAAADGGRRKIVIAGLVVGLLGAALLAYLLWPTNESPKQAAAPAPSPRPTKPNPTPTPETATTPTPTPASNTEAPAPAMITVRIESTPPGAAITLDGQPAGTTPLDLQRPQDQAEHRLRLEHAGYRPLDQTIRFDRAQTIGLVLRPTGRKPPKPPGGLEIKGGR